MCVALGTRRLPTAENRFKYFIKKMEAVAASR
jgi:hypothetical protein